MAVNALMATYARLPVTFTHGQGCWLYDEQDTPYLDALSGIAVCGLGHSHPAISRTIAAQAEKLIHTSNLYHIGVQEQLGAKLTEIAGMTNVFFANSGAEANEAAIKLARLYGHQRNISHPKIMVMEHSFHGRTLATLSATGNSKVQQGFTPLLEGFVRVPFNDLDAMATTLSQESDIVAVMLEPIQGEGGVNTPDSGYLAGVRTLCDQHQTLLVLDEIQTGNGRTGSYFACEQEPIKADILTTAKGLGNGMPIGACLAHGRAAELFGPGSHGSTFGGNPLACATALTVIETILADNLCQRALHIGERIRAAVTAELAEYPGFVEVTGRGAMIGIKLDRPCTELVQLALEQQLLINVAAGQVVRLLPPLIMNEEEIDQLLAKLLPLLIDFCRKKS